jgi:cytidine deaminase
MSATVGSRSAVLGDLSATAWSVQNMALLVAGGTTKVGCAVLADDGRIFAGCNIQHRFRCHDIHAETNAIGALVTAGARRLLAVLIAAEREGFTPCGACLDWIFELGGGGCVVYTQRSPDAPPVGYTAGQLMPHYPGAA